VFDADYYDNATGNTKIIFAIYEKDNNRAIESGTIEALCPYCIARHTYDVKDETFWPDPETRRLWELVAENKILRLKLSEERQANVEKDRQTKRLRNEKRKLAGECKRLADVVHQAQTGDEMPLEPPQQKDGKPKTGLPPYV
jgi:hypothetical protein